MPPRIASLLIVALLLSLASVSNGVSARDEILYYAAPHFPPWDINPNETASSGINVDVIRSIANDLGLRAQPIVCPWKRCLVLLEQGKIDMAGTVGKKPERERYLQFIEPSYAKTPDQVFYLPQTSPIELNAYRDLYQFDRIGIERGARVSPRFDQDTRLMKEELARLDQLLNMLDKNRLDVVVGNEMVMDYMIKEMGLQDRFRKAPFKFTSRGGEYLTISKKSPHAKRFHEIGEIIRKMKENGQIETVIEHYIKSNSKGDSQ